MQPSRVADVMRRCGPVKRDQPAVKKSKGKGNDKADAT